MAGRTRAAVNVVGARSARGNNARRELFELVPIFQFRCSLLDGSRVGFFAAEIFARHVVADYFWTRCRDEITTLVVMLDR